MTSNELTKLSQTTETLISPLIRECKLDPNRLEVSIYYQNKPEHKNI